MSEEIFPDDLNRGMVRRLPTTGTLVLQDSTGFRECRDSVADMAGLMFSRYQITASRAATECLMAQSCPEGHAVMFQFDLRPRPL